jgi:DNA-binding NtrC family response regulator
MTDKIVFIDDNLSCDDAIVQSVKNYYQLEEDDYRVFNAVRPGVEYVLHNLSSKIIVLIDCRFEPKGQEEGIDALKSIRETTSLVYIIMMSANGILQNSAEDIMTMINEDYIHYFERSTSSFKDLFNLIDKINIESDSRIDCVLEKWLSKHKKDTNNPILMKGNKSYTWGDLLVNLRKGTKEGCELLKMFTQYLIYNVSENKEDDTNSNR